MAGSMPDDTWWWEVVDAVGHVGYWSEMAETDEVTGIAYYDDTRNRVKFAYAAPWPAAPFPDVDSQSSYVPQIARLSREGVISGYSNGNFGPDDSVKRAQFAKMIDLAVGLTVTEADACPFPDVESGALGTLYPDHYVGVAAKSGFIRGYDDGTFRPYESITRAQMVTMVARAARSFLGDALDEVAPGYVSVLGSFSPVHAPEADYAAYNGLLQYVFPDNPDPWAPASRSECAAILANLMELGPFSSTG